MTGLLTTSGSQFQDWSAAYRMFSRLRLDPARLFAGIRCACLDQLPQSAPVCISIDDSLLTKTGTKIPGVAWRRDPQGPPFQVNFVRAQRVLQFSALLAIPNSSAVRGIPIDFIHTPTPPKLSKNATKEEQEKHRKLSEQLNLSTRACEQFAQMRATLGSRPVILLSDARFTNERFLKGLSGYREVTLIGRIRQDAKLCFPPVEQPARGRRRLYGEPCPTPNQIRQDDTIAWQTIPVHAAGADHLCRIKVVDNVLWRPAGAQCPLRLIVIAPLAYRPRKGARLLYRDPAYLICTNPHLPAQQIVQRYFWRWDIEVNFREEKTLLGVGQAQVRNQSAVQAVPAFQVAAYALFLLAALELSPHDLLPQPKWSRTHAERISTQRLLQHLRYEVWGRGLEVDNFSGFCPRATSTEKPQIILPSLASAVFYAQA